MNTSPAEQFLIDFHNQQPGITSHSFQSLSATMSGQLYTSSYECLAKDVASDATVLDLACGDGFLLSILPARTLIGVDMSTGELAAARQRLGDRTILHHGKAQSLPVENQRCDIVLCHMALMLMDQLDDVLGEIQRVLKPSGHFSFVIGAAAPPSAVMDAYITRLRALYQHESAKALRFGDQRLAKEESIISTLTPYFTQIKIEKITISRRYTPDEVWSWFEGCYDLAFLATEPRQQFHAAYLQELAALCEDDGKVAFADCMLKISARAAAHSH
ncbi:class I SAM-dependent methyltransferase [Iodobacter fluviatilis]|uniref:Methyltransferase family protein n=1 Tax=Iodobacter fluviatilis TaxID=537 RepID=A0A377Q9L0_9NEIS|nr:class I SAM-dependent methyltransferase [Iodobacter fluviatilis]TCU88421.1 methyltransferase family protein [Iodobacter fluviatilis]STQ91507.1 Trans-aconitate methyltransferase [Iodobacter fluviatilis]